jgi:hypothetical protein
MRDLDLNEEQLQDAAEFEAALDTPAWENPLEDLFTEVQLAAIPKRNKQKTDPAVKPPTDTEKLRKLYNDPANWTRTRGLALIDKESKTLIGNFSEYTHNTVLNTRKLVREHQPIAIDGTELIDGYLGEEVEQTVRRQSWDKEFELVVDLVLDELQVEAHTVPVKVLTRFGATVRVELQEYTQFASASGNLILQLTAGTDVFAACSIDTKITLRKGIE